MARKKQSKRQKTRAASSGSRKRRSTYFTNRRAYYRRKENAAIQQFLEAEEQKILLEDLSESLLKEVSAKQKRKRGKAKAKAKKKPAPAPKAKRYPDRTKHLAAIEENFKVSAWYEFKDMLYKDLMSSKNIKSGDKVYFIGEEKIISTFNISNKHGREITRLHEDLKQLLLPRGGDREGEYPMIALEDGWIIKGVIVLYYKLDEYEKSKYTGKLSNVKYYYPDPYNVASGKEHKPGKEPPPAPEPKEKVEKPLPQNQRKKKIAALQAELDLLKKTKNKIFNERIKEIKAELKILKK